MGVPACSSALPGQRRPAPAARASRERRSSSCVLSSESSMANQYANESKRAMSGATPKPGRRDGRQLVLPVGTIQQPASGATVAASLGQSLEQPPGPQIRAVRCQVGVAEDPDQAACMGYREPPPLPV